MFMFFPAATIVPTSLLSELIDTHTPTHKHYVFVGRDRISNPIQMNRSILQST